MEHQACLFDKIKQKEQDFIKTLKDIAEAAFITDSLTTGNNIDMDDNQVDSDLSKVAREISRSTNNILDDNSDADCDDTLEDAVLDRNHPDDERDITQNHQCDQDLQRPCLENSHTIIKMDVIDELDENMEHHPQQINLVESKVEDQEDHERRKSFLSEKCDKPTEENQESCWKIDYIRVEPSEMSKQKRKPFSRSEVWKTNKTARVGKKKKSSKERDKDKRRNRKKEIGNFCIHETVASKKDRASLKKPVETLQNIPKVRYKKTKAVDKLSDVLKVKSLPGWSPDEMLENGKDNYNPSVPRGTSQQCIEALSDSDLEIFPCPACKDRFLLPTTFFQHLFRKSIQIQFKCSICRKCLIFHNKCSLKIHILSHLENDDVEYIETDMLEVMSLNNSEVKLNSDTHNIKKELRSMNVNETTEDLCLECLQPVSKAGLMGHFSTPNEEGTCYECKHCGEPMPTKCSQTAHEKIHTKKTPYVCPECGKSFHTWQYFKTHQTNVCYHHMKTVLKVCPQCPKDCKFTASKEAVLLHIVESHCTKYYKCCECPSAFREESILSSHMSEKHNSQTFTKQNLYKLKKSNGSKFYTNKDSLFEDISISIKLPSVFLLQCACQETFFASIDLSEHLEKHYDCRLKIKRSYLLFQDSPEESSFQREIMDNLKYFQVS